MKSGTDLRGRWLIIQSSIRSKNLPLWVGLIFLLIVVFVDFHAIKVLNNGIFTYTIDDAYIHLALAENIIDGHYGINFHEVSSPSSSILWPFLLSPLSSIETSPFFLNVLASIVAVYLYYRILDKSFKIDHPINRLIIISILIILLILSTNIIGLIFTGMEHSLQVLMVTTITLGLIMEIEGEKVKPWLLVAIVFSPLIRYENASISIGALGYLFLRKHNKKAIFALLLMVFLMSGFSSFLTSLGLPPLPTSVLAKAPVLPMSDIMSLISNNLEFSLLHAQGRFLVVGLLCLLGYLILPKQTTPKKYLAAITSFAIIMHLTAGRIGWNNRYEIYIWTFFLLVAIYIAGDEVSQRIVKDARLIHVVKLTSMIGIFMTLTSLSYLVGLVTLPTAANNIYEQHYQMHRFAVEFYRKPIAVNDLGYVSYKNNQYVLDLWGIVSIDVFKHRVNNQSSAWMNDLVRSKSVEFAMIYEAEFKEIPDHWIKVGKLHLSRSRITPLYNSVTFYALTEVTKFEVMPNLRAFIKTLPDGVEFIFHD